MKKFIDISSVVLFVLGIISGIIIFLALISFASVIFDGTPYTGSIMIFAMNPVNCVIMISLIISAFFASKRVMPMIG
ncbi:MAG: hypothetical protein ACM3PZ_02205 [Bacillota bacterium]